jgi:CheY-like chemotaxis protein
VPKDDAQRVLVVEDEAVIAMELEDLLGDLGHEVVDTVGSLERGLELLEHLRPLPDIAIVDANLGGESSQPLVEALRKLGVPVVVASGYRAGELERLGFDHQVISKPYSPRDIAAALSRNR